MHCRVSFDDNKLKNVFVWIKPKFKIHTQKALTQQQIAKILTFHIKIQRQKKGDKGVFNFPFLKVFIIAKRFFKILFAYFVKRSKQWVKHKFNSHKERNRKYKYMTYKIHLTPLFQIFATKAQPQPRPTMLPKQKNTKPLIIAAPLKALLVSILLKYSQSCLLTKLNGLVVVSKSGRGIYF